MDVLVDVLDVELSDDEEDEDVLLLVVDSLFFSVELLDDFSALSEPEDFFESPPRLSLR